MRLRLCRLGGCSNAAGVVWDPFRKSDRTCTQLFAWNARTAFVSVSLLRLFLSSPASPTPHITRQHGTICMHACSDVMARGRIHSVGWHLGTVHHPLIHTTHPLVYPPTHITSVCISRSWDSNPCTSLVCGAYIGARV